MRRGELSAAEEADAASHVRGCEECRDLPDSLWMQDTLSADAGGPSVASEAETRAEGQGSRPVFRPAPGARVGAFVLGSPIGRGAFGHVFAATGDDGAVAAIKLLPADRCDEPVRRRFRREAEALASLRHPNVVGVVAYGSTEDGGLYLATELLEGEDLARRLSRGLLSAEEVGRLGVLAAAGLGAAHVAGIVHRDVKPANLWLCRDGGVKVLDFGLAIRVAGDVDTRFTSSDVLIGTPAYMAPEQAQGAGSEDAQTDVWGLGATLYHALAGRPPFDAPTSMAQLVRVVTDEPTPPPPATPPWLRDVLRRALTRDKASRMGSMAELASALESGLASSTGAPVAPAPAAAIVPLGDEVRIVSVLLAEELEGFEAFAAAVRAEHGQPSPLVGRRGVGIFGGEAWRGDEAERAVRAGLAVRRAGGAQRLGVATGRAVHSRAREITGDVVVAAEAALADVGVGADAETRRRTRGGFHVEADALLAERTGHGVVGVRGLEGADVPIVGRARELGDLVMTLEQAVSDRQATGVLLIGPAGIGKSRLRHALLARLAEESRPILTLEARGESHRTLEGWHAIANALRAWAGLPEGTAAATVRARLARSAPHAAAAELLAEMLGAGTGEAPSADPHGVRDRMLVAVGDLFEELTRAQPVVLVFEDVQWADGPSVELVDVLLRRLEGAPLFVLASSRPEGGALDGSVLPDLRRIVLGGLSRQETRELVASILPDDPSGETADAIFDRSGGNPYFVEELAIGVREGRSELPTSVEAAVQARLDALPRHDKDLLRRAAVLGRRFWAQALAAMGEADPAPVLQRLRRAELVAPEPRPRLLGTTEWRFRHTIVQEVAYASLTDEQRAALHRGAASWLAAREDARAAEVAQHFERAGASDEALPWWQRAAEVAFREGDAALGLEASARAIAHETDPHAAFRMRNLRAEALHFLGRGDEVAAEVEALAALAETPEERARVAQRRTRSLWLRGEYDAAEAVVDAGLAAAPDSAILLVEKTWVCAWRGRIVEGERLARRAVAHALESGDAVALGRARNALSQCLFQLGDIAEARHVCVEALAVVESTRDPRFIAAARGFLAYADLELGRYESAVAELGRARDLSRASNNRRNEGWALHNLGLALARMGRMEEGLATERAALTIAREVGEPRLCDACTEYLASILLAAGLAGEALATLDEAVGTMPPEHVKTEFRALRAQALVQLGRREEARAEAEAALASRAAAGAMWEFEATLFLAAHGAGIAGALAEGLAALGRKARLIPDPEMRATFLERVPEHARLLAVAREAGLDVAAILPG